MSSIDASTLLGAGADGYQIERSLRFNSADSAYLNRTFGTPTNNIKWTWSGWVKRSTLGSYQNLFCGDDGTSNNFLNFRISDNNDRIDCFQISGGSYNLQLVTDARFRDPSAWYHVVLIYDSANATSTDRVQIYVNGTRQTVSYPVGPFAQNTACQANVSSRSHAIGRVLFASANYLDGYLTEIHFIDGQALTPSSFGETDTITGVWKPKKYAGTYGTNGFYLKFADNSGTTSTTLGKDSSGNGNNWTPNNFSVTAGAGNDSLIDTPTPYADGGNGRGNYATLSPLTLGTSCSLTNGNLDASWTSVAVRVNTQSNFGIPTSGKWYWEVTLATNTNGNATFGVVGAGYSPSAGDVGDPASGYALAPGLGGSTSMTKRNNNSNTSWGAATTSFGAGITYGIAVNMDTGSIFFRDATGWMNASNSNDSTPTTAAYTGLSGTYVPAVGHYSIGSQSTAFNLNFGQRAFAYTPPSGFLALNTQNLPEPLIKKPSSYMDVLTWSGTGGGSGATRSLTGLGFSPDLVWQKARSSGTNHRLLDAVRGAGTGKTLSSNTTSAEGDGGSSESLYGYLSSFDSNGFTLTNGTSTFDNGNKSGDTYVAWCWDESATPGFDIVTYTGNGTNRTIAHSLGVAPKMIIVKNRTTAGTSWAVYTEMTGAANYLRLNSTIASTAGSTFWNSTAPTSSVFSVGTDSDVNANTNNHVAYLWSEVAGFSKFGSYVSNGSSDGSFCFCGFRPKVVWIKKTTGSTNANTGWYIFDSVRGAYNVTGPSLRTDLSDAESTFNALDFTSNGFKLRVVDIGVNTSVSGDSYIFCAWAETPAKYSLAR